MDSQVTRVGFTVNAGSAVPRGEFKHTDGDQVRLVRIERVTEITGGKMLVQAVIFPATYPARIAQLTEATFL
jgi:hypothetical protein